MKILLTGASGYLGNQLRTQLSQFDNIDLTLLVRSPLKTELPEIITNFLTPLTSNYIPDVIINAAASLNPLHQSTFIANTDIIRYIKNTFPSSKICHISSLIVFPQSSFNEQLCLETPLPPNLIGLDWYTKSKLAIEYNYLSANDLIIRPGLLVNNTSMSEFTPSDALYSMCQSLISLPNTLNFTPNLKFDASPVDWVSACICSAIQQQLSGVLHLASPTPVSIESLMTIRNEFPLANHSITQLQRKRVELMQRSYHADRYNALNLFLTTNHTFDCTRSTKLLPKYDADLPAILRHYYQNAWNHHREISPTS